MKENGNDFDRLGRVQGKSSQVNNRRIRAGLLCWQLFLIAVQAVVGLAGMFSLMPSGMSIGLMMLCSVLLAYAISDVLKFNG